MIQKGITITDEQNKYVDKTFMSLSKFVQDKLNEKMEDDQHD